MGTVVQMPKPRRQVNLPPCDGLDVSALARGQARRLLIEAREPRNRLDDEPDTALSLLAAIGVGFLIGWSIVKMLFS